MYRTCSVHVILVAHWKRIYGIIESVANESDMPSGCAETDPGKEGIMELFFTKLVGTLAVILVIATFIGGSNLTVKFLGGNRDWKYTLLAGILGGIFGIYGNISGVSFKGAVISVRDIGPMLSGFTGGPIGGIIGGAIAGIHRYTMGGITAGACVIATLCIGLFCGLFSRRHRSHIPKPLTVFLTGAAMETFHLLVVLIMVKPFSTALDIVRTIAFPFVLVNALGFMLLLYSISYTEKQRALAIEQSRLSAELEAASVIQHSLLPPVNDAYPGRKELMVSASMEAAKNVGGDFYDLFFLDSDRLVFLIADVSGKGIPAAMFMATAKMTLQNCIRDIPDLAEAVYSANESLCSRNEAEMFVTAWIGVLNIAEKTVDYVCAGHNPPVLMRKDSTAFIRSRSGFILAGMPGMRYQRFHIDLEPEDTLFLYTDGVTEAENAMHEQYGEARLLQCLSAPALRDVPASAVIDQVRDDVAAHVHGYIQSDDLTILCIRIAGN